MELFEYEIKGIAESVEELGNVPNIVLTMVLNRFGIPSLVAAEGNIEV